MPAKLLPVKEPTMTLFLYPVKSAFLHFDANHTTLPTPSPPLTFLISFPLPNCLQSGTKPLLYMNRRNSFPRGKKGCVRKVEGVEGKGVGRHVTECGLWVKVCFGRESQFTFATAPTRAYVALLFVT